MVRALAGAISYVNDFWPLGGSRGKMFTASYTGNNKKIFWQELWRHEFMEILDQDPVVIVPTGSVEQHGPHCPMDVDIAGPFYMAVASAQRVDDFPVLVAPPVWSGFTHYNMGFPGTISLRLETYQNLLADVLRSIYANGFPRIVVLNGHGGNTAPNRAVTTQLGQEDIFPITFSYWQAVSAELSAWSEADAGSIGHGGEWETSLQLYLRPHLIDERRMVADVFPNPYSADLREFAEYAERRRDTAGGTGVMGNPLVASAEKGARLFNAITDKLVRLVMEMHRAPVRRYKEFGSHCP
jgi:creatinine amidohydrolase